MLAWDGPYCPFIHCADGSARPGPWAIRSRRLAHWLLVVSLDGSENIEVEGRPHAIPAGGSYLIQPGRLHSLASRGNRPVWIHFDLSFDAKRRHHPHAGPYASDLGRRHAFLQPDARAVWGVDLPVAVPEPVAPLIAAGVPRLVRRWAEGTPLAILDATHQLAGMLIALVGHQLPDGAGRAPLPERIDRAERIARDRLAARIDAAGMAAAVGMSRGHFSSVYTRLRGRTPATFLREARLDLAEHLLGRPELPVAQVGALVGYPEPTVFCRVFRRRHGVGPAAWRQGFSARAGGGARVPVGRGRPRS